jgi:elongation factor P
MNGMVNINDIKNGMTIIYDGKLCMVQSFQHVKPGKGAAFMKVKLRNLKTGSITEETINSSVKVEKAHVDKKAMVYLYNSGTGYVFMDNETYEQTEVPEEKLE